MLNKYETIFIIAPAVEDKAAVVEKFTTMINSEGKIDEMSTDVMIYYYYYLVQGTKVKI